MKKTRFFAIGLIIALVLSSVTCSAYTSDDGKIDQSVSHENEISMYKYDLYLEVTNPINSDDMDNDAVNIFKFTFTYKDRNGNGNENKYVFDMSWNNGKNRNADILKKYFIRANDNGYKTTLSLWVPGLVSKVDILLNMDGGERLSFNVKNIRCNGIAINTTQDYVSSAYNDSKASISLSTGKSIPQIENAELTKTYLECASTDGGLRDQYNALTDFSVIRKLIENYDGEINQNLSHSDEEEMYLYTLKLNVENPIDTSSCDADALCTLKFVFTYKSENGYGEAKKYTLDMSYINGRNLNDKFIKCFVREGSDAFKSEMKLWIPGILTKVEILLNMDGGERLNFSVDGIFLNGFRANTNTDYVSSAFYDSEAEINCRLPDAKIIPSDGTLYDCYGAIAGKKLLSLYAESADRYSYGR